MKSTKKLHSVDSILDRIKDFYNHSSDAEMARFLGVKPGTVSAWRSRNSMDYQLVLTKCSDIPTDWLLFDKGRKHKDNTFAMRHLTAEEPGKHYTYDQFTLGLIKQINEGPYSSEVKTKVISCVLDTIEEAMDEREQES